MRAARKSYMSDITDEQWELLKGFIPAAKPGGRPRKVEVREVVNAIFYILNLSSMRHSLIKSIP